MRGVIKNVSHEGVYVAEVQFGEDFITYVTSASFMLGTTEWVWEQTCVNDDHVLAEGTADRSMEGAISHDAGDSPREVKLAGKYIIGPTATARTDASACIGRGRHTVGAAPHHHHR